jgi:hypothetical protein
LYNNNIKKDERGGGDNVLIYTDTYHSIVVCRDMKGDILTDGSLRKKKKKKKWSGLVIMVSVKRRYLEQMIEHKSRSKVKERESQ